MGGGAILRVFSYFILFYFISFYFILFYFTLFYDTTGRREVQGQARGEPQPSPKEPPLAVAVEV